MSETKTHTYAHIHRELCIERGRPSDDSLLNWPQWLAEDEGQEHWLGLPCRWQKLKCSGHLLLQTSIHHNTSPSKTGVTFYYCYGINPRKVGAVENSWRLRNKKKSEDPPVRRQQNAFSTPKPHGRDLHPWPSHVLVQVPCLQQSPWRPCSIFCSDTCPKHFRILIPFVENQPLCLSSCLKLTQVQQQFRHSWLRVHVFLLEFKLNKPNQLRCLSCRFFFFFFGC